MIAPLLAAAALVVAFVVGPFLVTRASERRS